MYRRPALLSVLLFTLSLTAKSQGLIMKLGEVPLQDLNMTTYLVEPEAGAAILGSWGEAKFVEWDKLVYRRHLRIKILSEKGLDEGSQRLYLPNEATTVVRGFTVNMVDGYPEKERLRAQNRSEVGVGRNNSEFDWVTLTFPNVKVGSVIDLYWEFTTSDFYLGPLVDYPFQFDIPVREQTFHFFIPEYLVFTLQRQGNYPISSLKVSEESVGMRVNKQSSRMVTTAHYLFYTGAIPAMGSEPYVDNRDNYRTAMTAELERIAWQGEDVEVFAKDWFGFEKVLREERGYYEMLLGTERTPQLAKEITADIATQEGKIDAVMDYVKSNFQWNGNKTRRLHQTHRELLESKNGNAAELNLLLCSLLDGSGITVKPVMLSTRDHGRADTSRVQLTDYNYVMVLAEIEGESPRLLDATEAALPNAMIPRRCRNGIGRALNGDGGYWVPLTNGEENGTTFKGSFALDEEGNLTGKLQILQEGYTAYDTRQLVKKEGDDARRNEILSTYDGWEYANYTAEDGVMQSQMWNETMAVTSDKIATTAGDRIYLNALLNFGWSENPFQSETRKYPVSFARAPQHQVMFQIQLPEGYVVEEMPENVAIGLPGNAAEYRLVVNQRFNVLTVIAKMDIKKDFFTVEEYPNLREFLSVVVANNDQQVVLKKVEATGGSGE